MSKNKNKSPKSDTSKATDPAAVTAPKKPRKPRDPNAPKLTWAQKQLKRLGKLIKGTTKLHKILAKHPMPGINLEDAQFSLENFQSLQGALSSEDVAAYKPKMTAQKVKIDSVIAVKNDTETLAAPVFTRRDPRTGQPYLNPAMFEGATVIGDERTAWMVSCADGQTRLISKKLITLAG